MKVNVMAVPRNTKLPDTPWHVGYTLKDENDPRRHKVWCIHLKNKKCTCRPCSCYMTRCVGSSHCTFYSLSDNQWKAYLEEMKTDEDRADDNADLHREQKREYVRALLENGKYAKKYRFFPKMINCPFCYQKIKGLSFPYCRAKFKIVEKMTEERILQEAKRGFFCIQDVK